MEGQNMRLRDKVAIVTGAASGIGQATAIRFVEEGATVVAVDTNEDGLKQTAEDTNFGNIYTIVGDISKEDVVVAVVTETMRQFGKIDCLINCAAKFIFKSLDATAEDWMKSLTANVISAALMTNHVATEMQERGKGAIVNLGSISSFMAQPGFTTYSATKAALVQMTRNYALDLGPFGIRVNCVCPGHTKTPAVARIARDLGRRLSDVEAELSCDPIFKRMAEAREIANAILFLASDEASYITGTSLMVDGGYSIL